MTRDDHCHGSHRQCCEEKKQNPGERRGEGIANRPGETCARREDIMKRNPSVGRKLPVTWLRQHAIVSGIIKHIGSICPWKRNTLSPRAIQKPSIDLCSSDRSVVLSLSLSLSIYLSISFSRLRVRVSKRGSHRGPTLSLNCFDRGSALRDRTGSGFFRMIGVIGFTSRNRSVEAKGELNVARGQTR